MRKKWYVAEKDRSLFVTTGNEFMLKLTNDGLYGPFFSEEVAVNFMADIAACLGNILEPIEISELRESEVDYEARKQSEWFS